MHRKISSKNVVAVLKQVPETLVKCAAERDQWKERALRAEQLLGEYQRREEVDKVAAAMVAKNLHQGLDPDELRDSLMQKAASGKLGVVAEAVNMSAKANPLGFLGEDHSTGEGGAAAEFENALIG